MADLGALEVMVIMFAALIFLLFSGMPVVFAMGSIGVGLLFLLWGTKVIPSVLPTNTFYIMTWYTIIAAPLFVFMAMVLQTSGVVEDLFDSIRLWFGGIPGGLAMAVVLVCTLIAAMSSAVATGILILGITALPYMLRVGYSKELSIGPLLAGSGLANLIPPSTTLVICGAISNVSIGAVMMGGIVPGLMLAGIFIIYIAIRSHLNPDLAPPLPPEERVGWWKKIASLKALVLPGALVIIVLGSIFFGICSPTEAAGAGALGALGCSAVKRKLNRHSIDEACILTLKVTSMLLWIFIGAYTFKSVYVLAGGPHFTAELVAGLAVPGLGIIGAMQAVFIFLGCFIGDLPNMVITLPVFLPIIDALGYSRVWFGVLMLTNLQIAVLTPPFGIGLFYMRSVSPPGVTIGDIMRSILPFIPLQLSVVILVMFFPQIVLWLPGLMF